MDTPIKVKSLREGCRRIKVMRAIDSATFPIGEKWRQKFAPKQYF